MPVVCKHQVDNGSALVDGTMWVQDPEKIGSAPSRSPLGDNDKGEVVDIDEKRGSHMRNANTTKESG